MTQYTGFQYGHPEHILPLHPGTQNRRGQHAWEFSQRLFASLFFIILSPLFIVMWVLVRSTSPGSFLFTQERPGLDGSEFKIYKIRTMRAGSEKQTALGITNRDSKVTRIGKILRALKLDELPQLWNIAIGDMALVGPRPIPLALDAELRKHIPGFEKRYMVRPGLTSIGQICVHDNTIGESLVADWKLRFEGELHYIRNRCLRYDFLIILMTGLYVIRKLVHK